MTKLEVREFNPRPTRQEHDRAVECEGKFKHASRSDAQRAIRRDSPGRRARCNPYRCRFCDGWHVGSSIIKNQRARW